MQITDLIPPLMAAISHGYTLPAIAVLLSMMMGIFTVLRSGYEACLVSGFFLAFSTYWVLSAAVMRTELPSAAYAQLQNVDNERYQQIIASRMKNGRLTYGDLYEAKAQYDREAGKRARLSLMGQPR